MTNTFRTIAQCAALPLLVLLAACPGGDTEAVPSSTSLRPSFQQDIPVRQLLPAPADSTWKDQKSVPTPIKVGPDSLPVMVMWTPTHRDNHRAISRIDVAFPEHPDSDSLSASLSGGSTNHGTTDAILQGLTLLVRWHRDGQFSNTIVHLTGDGKARLD
jgi:hypothetical protein